jgi:hypothetical protein
MRACNHAKKFICYQRHFSLDAKYLIMANAAMPVGLPGCDAVKPVFAAINFLWSLWSLLGPVVQRPARDAMKQRLR